MHPKQMRKTHIPAGHPNMQNHIRKQLTKRNLLNLYSTRVASHANTNKRRTQNPPHYPPHYPTTVRKGVLVCNRVNPPLRAVCPQHRLIDPSDVKSVFDRPRFVSTAHNPPLAGDFKNRDNVLNLTQTTGEMYGSGACKHTHMD